MEGYIAAAADSKRIAAEQEQIEQAEKEETARKNAEPKGAFGVFVGFMNSVS